MSIGDTPRAAVVDASKIPDSARKAAAKAALDLEKRGWTSIEGILSPQECEEYIDSVWDWLESLQTGIKR